MRKLSIILILVMILLTTIGLFPSNASFLFARGSDGLMQMKSAPFWIQFLLILCFIIVAFAFKGKSRVKTYLLPILFILWILSGRVVGLFPDGRLSTGWFYVETARLNICKNSNDCEKVYYYETEVQPLALWRIRIKNKEINKVIFVGPAIWSGTLKMFKKSFPKSTL